MNNKYYTPTIEEFHVGFEYSILTEDPTIYDTRIVETTLGLYNTIRLVEEKYGAISVKYLDVDDIKSCGFTFDEGTSKQYSIINKDNDKYSIYFDCLDRTDIIRDGIGIIIYNDISEELFRGYIKNKSEFKLLIKQLNII